MKQYPANMADFMDMFPTEDACLEYLSIVRWPDGYKCLRCGKGDYWKKAVAFSPAAHAGTRLRRWQAHCFRTRTNRSAYGFRRCGM